MVKKNSGQNLDSQCPYCGITVGDHTIREWQKCLESSGQSHFLPHADIPGGPLLTPASDGILSGSVVIRSGLIESEALGFMPVAQFIFSTPGVEPMERVSLPPITLVMDADGLRNTRTLFGQVVDRACLEARRRNRDG